MKIILKNSHNKQILAVSSFFGFYLSVQIANEKKTNCKFYLKRKSVEENMIMQINAKYPRQRYIKQKKFSKYT